MLRYAVDDEMMQYSSRLRRREAQDTTAVNWWTMITTVYSRTELGLLLHLLPKPCCRYQLCLKRSSFIFRRDQDRGSTNSVLQSQNICQNRRGSDFLLHIFWSCSWARLPKCLVVVALAVRIKGSGISLTLTLTLAPASFDVLGRHAG